LGGCHVLGPTRTIPPAQLPAAPWVRIPAWGTPFSVLWYWPLGLVVLGVHAPLLQPAPLIDPAAGSCEPDVQHLGAGWAPDLGFTAVLSAVIVGCRRARWKARKRPFRSYELPKLTWVVLEPGRTVRERDANKPNAHPLCLTRSLVAQGHCREPSGLVPTRRWSTGDGPHPPAELEPSPLGPEPPLSPAVPPACHKERARAVSSGQSRSLG
jgi:hypothetical protein